VRKNFYIVKLARIYTNTSTGLQSDRTSPDTSTIAFGSLPPIPNSLSLGDQLELNAINIEILAEREQHFAIKARMAFQLSRVEAARQEQSVAREALLQLRFQRRLPEIQKASVESVAMVRSPTLKTHQKR
jgi:hypothetical protein